MSVEEDRHRGPAEAPNLGIPSEPRPAASVVLLRRGGKHKDRALEVLLLKRTEEAKFMPGVWVFPGGAVDPADGEAEAGFRACAVRELAEEAAIALHRRRGAGPLLALDHPRGDLDPLRRLVLPRPRPRAHPAEAGRRRDRRRGLVRAARGPRRPGGRRPGPRLPDRQAARIPAPDSPPPRRRWPPTAAARSRRSCPRSSAARRTTASSCPGTRTIRTPPSGPTAG